MRGSRIAAGADEKRKRRLAILFAFFVAVTATAVVVNTLLSSAEPAITQSMLTPQPIQVAYAPERGMLPPRPAGIKSSKVAKVARAYEVLADVQPEPEEYVFPPIAEDPYELVDRPIGDMVPIDIASLDLFDPLAASPRGPRGGGPGVIDRPGGPGSAIPEPESWALMIGGFGLTGVALRRRRSIAQAA